VKKQGVFKNYQDFIMPTYSKTPVIFVKGKGSKIWDIDNNEYLDFFPGWGVSNVGHCHPKVMNAIREQVGKLIHLPNNYYHTQQAKLAEEIIFWSFKGKVFFCNSGAEAVEGAIKLARAYGHSKGRFEVITFENSFHGRTLAALAATGQKKYQEGFSPLPSGFKTVKFNDMDAVRKEAGEKTAAIILELIQGEGGINIADLDFVKDLRKFCTQNDILLIFDEVQTGMGRTGELFCFKNYGVIPDAMCLAKALGGGLPIGALVAQEKFADVLKPGMHASTFGGGPLVCKASLATFKAIQEEKMCTNAQKMGAYLMEKLTALKQKYNIIKEVRGMGLMVGVELKCEGKPIVLKCLEKRLLINCTHDTVLRLMPALNVTQKQVNQAISILDKVFSEVKT
jgi:predicted acetylornithine/succinylornithine family transaminase